MVSRQPTLGNIRLPILLHMILVRREDPGPAILEIDLHDTKSWCVAGRMANIDTGSEFEERAMECFPIEVEAEIFRQVHSNVTLRGDGIIRMFELLFMDVYRYSGAFEVFQTSSVIEMHMAHDDSLHVLNIMASLFDLRWKLVIRLVVHSGEYVVQRDSPHLPIKAYKSVCSRKAITLVLTSIEPARILHLPQDNPCHRQSRTESDLQ